MRQDKFSWPIVGQEKNIIFLISNIVKQKVAHAYLFYGPAHLGKQIVAEYFVASLFCSARRANQSNITIPCRQCANCQQIFKRIYPDVFWLEINTDTKEKATKNISIEQIRNLKKKVSLKPLTNFYQVVIIKNAESLSLPAVNALLKILEEPNKQTIFILLTDYLNFIPSTIRSRCRLLRFRLVKQARISSFLREQLHLAPKQANELSRLSNGRPGLAIRFAQQNKFLVDYQKNISDFIKVITEGIVSKFDLAKRIAKSSFKEINSRLADWQLIFRDIYLAKMGKQKLISHYFVEPEINSLAKHYSWQRLILISKNLLKLQQYLNQNVSARLAIENFLLKI